MQFLYYILQLTVTVIFIDSQIINTHDIVYKHGFLPSACQRYDRLNNKESHTILAAYQLLSSRGQSVEVQHCRCYIHGILENEEKKQIGVISQSCHLTFCIHMH